jgi:hypothetical protein
MEWGLTTSQIPFNLFETVWEIFMLLTVKIIEFKNGLLEYHVGTTVAGGNGNGSNANQPSYPNNLFVDNAENYVSDRIVSKMDT